MTVEGKATREQILDAAERRFAESGFDGVSMREIAAAAGLRNQASLYHHFRDKRALYEAVLARGIEALIGFVTGVAGEEAGLHEGLPSMEATLDRVIDYLVEHPRLPRLIQRAGIDDVQHLRGSVTRLMRPLFQQGIGALAVSGAPWPAEDLPHLAAAVYHMIFSYFASADLLGLVSRTDWTSPAAVARQRRLVKTAVALLLGARPAPRVTPLRTVRRQGGSARGGKQD